MFLGAIVNAISFLICLSLPSLLVYFCELMYQFQETFGGVCRVFHAVIMSSAKSESLTSSLPILMTFISFILSYC